MRLSDLLGSRVVDENGADLGRVRDVRLVQDGPLQGAFGAALRVDGVVAARTALGMRLGFHRAGVKGPWVLKAALGAIERHWAVYVSWDVVESWDGDTLRLGVGGHDLPTPEPA